MDAKVTQRHPVLSRANRDIYLRNFMVALDISLMCGITADGGIIAFEATSETRYTCHNRRMK